MKFIYCSLFVLALASHVIAADKAPRKLDWMPAEAVNDASRTAGGDYFVPEIVITETPRTTADAEKFQRVYVLELERFNIHTDNSHAVETSNGINQALQHAKTLNANRIVFPKGIYQISELDPVVIDHRQTIIDLNGATLQLRSNGLAKYSVIEIVDGAEDVRLTNGHIRGDKDTHDFSTGRGHEWGHGLVLHGGQGVEVDHLTVSHVTGDGVSTRNSGARTRPELLEKIKYSVYPRHLEQGAFDSAGAKVDSSKKMRSIEPFDLTSCGGQFEFGYSTGYLGYPFIKGRLYQAHFYDAKMKFIEMQKCLQFRKVTIPDNAQFVHLEFNQPAVSQTPAHAGAARGTFVGRITNFRPPCDVHFHHNTLFENRRLGLGFCGGNRWLIEDNLFERNGGTAPAYGIDFEDGWELMQDVVVRNNRFKDNVAGDLVICAGSELLIEDNVFEGNVIVHGRPHNYTFRNNSYTGGLVRYTTRTGVASIHNNTYKNCSLSILFDDKAVADGLNRSDGEQVATPPLMLNGEHLQNVSKVTGTYFKFTDATLDNVHFVAGQETRLIDIKNSRIENSSIQYEPNGPPVIVEIKNTLGAISEHGAGLKRKRNTLLPE
ncbi:hypothetical protein Fuma_01409 [Fuerstiella marisgermanici]|uniref:Right handed beta helix domain-containing protein n=2 Tax=Fuerstiella marisgermanici TaxID=1891926 RepID=A0A1P8WCM0_9PLAN|nr:hypothetical protein Fuma_01409 [Fuerstiella marisgermanici]